MEAKAYGRDRREWTFTGRSRAQPEQVYEVPVTKEEGDRIRAAANGTRELWASVA